MSYTISSFLKHVCMNYPGVLKVQIIYIFFFKRHFGTCILTTIQLGLNQRDPGYSGRISLLSLGCTDKHKRSTSPQDNSPFTNQFLFLNIKCMLLNISYRFFFLTDIIWKVSREKGDKMTK